VADLSWTVPLDSRSLWGSTPEQLDVEIAQFPITAATPARPAELLRVARRLLLFTMAEYSFGVVAALTAIQALEVALRIRLARPRLRLELLIDMAAATDGLLTTEAVEVLHAGRKLRNLYAHPNDTTILSIPMVVGQVRTSHLLMAELYP
jgi:hypothetical protein